MALTCLYVAFKYLSKLWLNRLLNGYLSIIGTAGFARFLLFLLKKTPLHNPDQCKYQIWKTQLTASQIACSVLAVTLTAAHLWTSHWVLSNLFGLSFAFNAISLLKLDSFLTGMLLLSGLFVYDVVMVFYTPMMVSVATDFQAPIKIVYPRSATADKPAGFAMLGLGESPSFAPT